MNDSVPPDERPALLDGAGAAVTFATGTGANDVSNSKLARVRPRSAVAKVGPTAHRLPSEACRLSGKRGSPSSGMGSHGAAYATNCRTEGRMPGSSSNVPIRIPIDSGCAGLEPNSADPHSPQNHFSPPLSGLQTRSLSSPATIRNDSGAGCACAEAAVPLRRWQRRQWQ